MNWFERVSEDIEEIISEECGLLEELISSGAMQIVTRPYQKNPEIIIHYFDDEENPPLVISYNIQENYFYREIEPPDENMPAIRFMFKDIDKLVEYIHNFTHRLMEDEEDDDNYDCDEMEHFADKNDFMEHMENIALEKEANDEYLKNVKWFSNIESSAKMDIPIKREIKTKIQFGEIEERNEFIIKKTRFLNDEDTGKVELSYLKLNKEEAEAVKVELDKYTAS